MVYTRVLKMGGREPVSYRLLLRAKGVGHRRVEVGTDPDWQRHNDHRPLLVELSHETVI